MAHTSKIDKVLSQAFAVLTVLTKTSGGSPSTTITMTLHSMPFCNLIGLQLLLQRERVVDANVT